METRKSSQGKMFSREREILEGLEALTGERLLSHLEFLHTAWTDEAGRQAEKHLLDIYEGMLSLMGKWRDRIEEEEKGRSEEGPGENEDRT